MRGRSDEELLRRAVAGDRDAFGQFYARRVDLVMAYLRRRTPNADTAADLCAEVFVAVLVGLIERGSAPDNAVAWTLTVAQRKLTDSWRRSRVEDGARRQMELVPVTLLDEDLERIDRLTDEARVLELVEQLPEQQRAAVRGRVLNDRDYRELSGELRTSELVVRQRVSRGLRALRAALEES